MRRKYTGSHPIDVQVGANIKRLRVSRGLTQERLAHRVGITYQQQAKREAGTNRISSSALVETARALDVSLTELFVSIETPAPGSLTHRNRRLLELASHLEVLPDPEFENHRQHIAADAQVWRQRLATQAEAAE